MMKKTLIASALLAGSSAAMAEFSGNVALATDYVFRGISQTDNQVAIQGGFDYVHESGIYAGTWASNVDPSFFNPASPSNPNGGNDPQIEHDMYIGYSSELANGIGYDVGFLYYSYPGFNDANTNEIYLKGSYKDFSASINYSDELDFLPSTESAWYIAGGYDMKLPADFGLSFHVGYNFGDAFDVAISTPFKYGFRDSYTDWSVGLTKSLMGIDLGLTYTDNNIDNNDCNLNICDSKFVFSVSKSL